LRIECGADRADLLAALAPLADRATTLATAAERAFSHALGGSCQTPLAAYAEWEEDRLWLRGLLAARDGRDVMRGELESAVTDVAEAQGLGAALADQFLARGAHRLAVGSA
jgi:hydroxymethylbilane synthase